MWHAELVVRRFDNLQQATFRVLRFTLDDLRFHRLARHGILNKHHERPFFCFQAGNALATKSHVRDLKREHLPFVEGALDASIPSHFSRRQR